MSLSRTLWIALVVLAASSPVAMAGPPLPPDSVTGCNFNDDATNDLAFSGDGTNRVNLIEGGFDQGEQFFSNGNNKWQLQYCVRIAPTESAPLGGAAGVTGLVSAGVSGGAVRWVRIEQVSASGQAIESTRYVGRGGGSQGVWDLVGTADVDGDDAQDLVFAGRAGTSAEPFGKVEIVFGANAGQNFFFPLGGGIWDFAGKGDIDADGDEDLFFTSEDGSALRIDAIENLAVDATSFLPLAGGFFTLAGIGDVTGDGKVDLVLDAVTAVKVAQLEDGQETGTLFLPTGGGIWKPRLLADSDGNGAKDVLLFGEAGSDLERFTRIDLMSQSGLALEDRGFINNFGMEAALTGDYDADGKEDLVVTDGDRGITAIILLDGKTNKPPERTGFGPNDPFEVVTE